MIASDAQRYSEFHCHVAVHVRLINAIAKSVTNNLMSQINRVVRLSVAKFYTHMLLCPREIPTIWY